MIRRESKFGLTLRHWILANPSYTHAIEAKQTTTGRLPFSAVKQSQIDWALAIKHSEKGVLIRCLGGSGEPDYICLYKEPSYVAVKYPGFFCLIDIDAWVSEKDASKSASLSSDRARKIADRVIELKEKGGTHDSDTRDRLDRKTAISKPKQKFPL